MYEIKFIGKTFKNGFIWGSKAEPIPEDGIYKIIGKGKHGMVHLLEKGKERQTKISIHKNKFKIIRLVE